jgi:hypothetical protein
MGLSTNQWWCSQAVCHCNSAGCCFQVKAGDTLVQHMLLVLLLEAQDARHATGNPFALAFCIRAQRGCNVFVRASGWSPHTMAVVSLN